MSNHQLGIEKSDKTSGCSSRGALPGTTNGLFPEVFLTPIVIDVMRPLNAPTKQPSREQ